MMLTFTELEQALLISGLTKLQLSRVDKDGTITIGPAESQFVTKLETVTATIAALTRMLPDQTNVFGDVLERRAMRLCTGYLKMLIMSLTTKVLPEYDQRMAKAGSDKLLRQRYQLYVLAAKDKLEIASKLYNKLERAL